MNTLHTISLTLDRRLLEHPRAYHLRRMRAGIWLYLDLLARLPAGADTFEVEPAAVAGEMGVSEGFVRSWLGHLSKAGYLESHRLNGKVRVSVKKGATVASTSVPDPAAERTFTVAKLQRMLKDKGNLDAFGEVLGQHSDAVIRRAVAGALAPPDEQIHRSRTALFLYLIKKYAQHNT